MRLNDKYLCCLIECMSKITLNSNVEITDDFIPLLLTSMKTFIDGLKKGINNNEIEDIVEREKLNKITDEMRDLMGYKKIADELKKKYKE